MTPAETELRELLATAFAEGRTITDITDAAEVPYHRVWQWLKGGTESITVATADALFRALTEKGIRP